MHLEPYDDDQNIYIVYINDSWTARINNGVSMYMVYVDEDGKIFLHHPSLSKLKL
jgi:hypothetical protein